MWNVHAGGIIYKFISEQIIFFYQTNFFSNSDKQNWHNICVFVLLGRKHSYSSRFHGWHNIEWDWFDWASNRVLTRHQYFFRFSTVEAGSLIGSFIQKSVRIISNWHICRHLVCFKKWKITWNSYNMRSILLLKYYRFNSFNYFMNLF